MVHHLWIYFSPLWWLILEMNAEVFHRSVLKFWTIYFLYVSDLCSGVMGCLYRIAADAHMKYNLRFKQEFQAFLFV